MYAGDDRFEADDRKWAGTADSWARYLEYGEERREQLEYGEVVALPAALQEKPLCTSCCAAQSTRMNDGLFYDM